MYTFGIAFIDIRTEEDFRSDAGNTFAARFGPCVRGLLLDLVVLARPLLAHRFDRTSDRGRLEALQCEALHGSSEYGSGAGGMVCVFGDALSPIAPQLVDALGHPPTAVRAYGPDVVWRGALRGPTAQAVRRVRADVAIGRVRQLLAGFAAKGYPIGLRGWAAALSEMRIKTCAVCLSAPESSAWAYGDGAPGAA